MGRLRTSFMSAMNYINSGISSGEDKDFIIRKAAQRYDEDEIKLKHKIEKDLRKQNRKETKTWTAYIGPIYPLDSEPFNIKIKTNISQNPKDNIEEILSDSFKEELFIREEDWSNFSFISEKEKTCNIFLLKNIVDEDSPYFFINNKNNITRNKIKSLAGYKIDEDIKNKINYFNSLKEKHISDYLALKSEKTDDLDSFSENMLRELFSPYELLFVKTTLASPEDQDVCLKWSLRGLSLQDSILRIIYQKGSTFH